MNYNDYKISRNLAWEIIINERITALPVRTARLCNQLGIELKAYDGSPDGSDGESTIVCENAVILYNRNKPIPRQRFTVAHELGHILLGHVGKYELINREPSDGDNLIEQAANVFASRLLAPACVLWALNVHTPDEIMTLCDISRPSAEHRATRMKILYERNKFLVSPLERQVLKQFQPFIENYKRGS